MCGGGAPLKPPIPNRKLFSLRFEKCNSFEFTVNGEALPPSYYAIETDIFIKVACCHVARLRELRQTGLQRIHENVAFTHVFKTNQIRSYFFGGGQLGIYRGSKWARGGMPIPTISRPSHILLIFSYESPRNPRPSHIFFLSV